RIRAAHHPRRFRLHVHRRCRLGHIPPETHRRSPAEPARSPLGTGPAPPHQSRSERPRQPAGHRPPRPEPPARPRRNPRRPDHPHFRGTHHHRRRPDPRNRVRLTTGNSPLTKRSPTPPLPKRGRGAAYPHPRRSGRPPSRPYPHTRRAAQTPPLTTEGTGVLPAPAP